MTIRSEHPDSSGHLDAASKNKLLRAIDPTRHALDASYALLVMALETVAEADTICWLVALRANESPKRISYRTIARDFYVDRDSRAYFRSIHSLKLRGILSNKPLDRRYSEVRLSVEQVERVVAPLVSAMSKIANPQQVVCNLSSPTAFARICSLLRNREQAILLCWLHQAVAADAPVQLTTRSIEQALMGLVDRRTAMRVLERLAVAGLVSIESRGRAGSVYALNGPALSQLLDSFPFPAEAAMSLPGWATHSSPLFERIAALTTVEASAIADAQQLTTGAEDGVAGVDGSTVHAGATSNFAGVPADAAGASAQLSREA